MSNPQCTEDSQYPHKKIQKPNTTERKKTLLWVLTGREGPGSPEAPEYHSITQTHGDPPERIRAVNSSEGNARHPLLRGAVGCCSASGLPLVSLPGTTHHRVLQITCPASFLTPRRNHGKNCSLGMFQCPLKSRLPIGYTAQTPSRHPALASWSQCSHSTEVR